MDLHNIKGPKDYHQFYHTSSESLVWSDGRGNPIPFSHTLGPHVEAIDPNDLWKSIQTRNKVHKHSIPVHGHGHSNNTTNGSNTPLMTTPTSPIMEHHVEISQLEGFSMVTVKELLEDLQIQPSMMQFALNAISFLFTASKTTQSARSDHPEVPHQVSVASTPTSNDFA